MIAGGAAARDHERGPIEQAVCADLTAMGELALRSALGASLVDLARRQDGTESAATAAQVAKELRAGLVELARAFPPVSTADELDELRRRRERA